MVMTTNGNIFESTADLIVNPVNCVGIMGKGLAKEFKQRYPSMFEYYTLYCKSQRLFVGSLFVYKCQTTKKPDYIVCFPTKIHWNEKSEYTYIRKGLNELKETTISLNIKSIAIPALGCGLGELDFNEVLKMIVETLSILQNVNIFVFKPWEK
jgi:O-acetyl-ADP-ribose deacetylase (regulator of RNase III)